LLFPLYSSESLVHNSFKFLSQAQDILPQNIIQATSAVEQPDYYSPFHFNIARYLASSSSNVPEHCLQLPPSLELGEVFVEQTTSERYAQPSITYQLRATVELIEEGIPSLLKTSMPVILRAKTTEYPPTETEDFPSEFKEFESRVIRKTLTGRPLGTLAISIQEPPALKYGSHSSQSSTKGQLRMDFEAADSSNASSTLKDMKFTLYSLIRVKTFYSVTPFPRLPSQSLLVSNDGFKLHDALIKLEGGRKYPVSWGHRNNMDKYSISGSIGSTVGSPPAYDAPTKQQSSPHAPVPDGKWTAIIEVPINLHTRVAPTFCNSLVARVYSLIVRLRISGVKSDFFDFEVPLQVVHSHILGEDIAEPIRDHFTLIEARRRSEDSWFSDHSLVSILYFLFSRRSHAKVI
jgi:hypothetical protein